MLDPAPNTWISPYLPGYSAVRALFHLGGAQWMTNPCLAMLTVLAMVGVSSRLWPSSKVNQGLALLMLVTSPQFLINSMTSYAYPAHLCVNLFWLWLYSRNDRLGLMLAPWVGVLAMGLHQPVVHVLFAAPFLVRLLWSRSWRLRIYTVCIYTAGSLFWIYWLFRVRSGFDPLLKRLASRTSRLTFPSPTQWGDQADDEPVDGCVRAVRGFDDPRSRPYWDGKPQSSHPRLSELRVDVLFYVFTTWIRTRVGYRYIYSVQGN
jgi:hypothetical protein